MTPDETAWKSAYANEATLPLVSDSTWKNNLSEKYLAALLDGLHNLETYASPTFTFDKATFEGLLTDAVGTGVAGLQAAFAAAALSSTWLIPIGTTFELVPTLATTFSTLGVATVDPDSVDDGVNLIGELDGATPTSDPLDSQFPIKLRAAFMVLKYNVVGTNSVIPTPGSISDLLRGVE